ncbi:RING finger protein [Plakobranchus ocellatus]|uniref:RING finger protein n=1 Tax=Plakobranchus ocellatus TaxID=259542 RepID=A0AAV4C306_9GAST|nr:RING finger protein [Plakobranchus ocellatus]
MENRRRNHLATSPHNLEESQARSNRNTVMMGNNTAASINGGSHSRRQSSHHHHQAGSGQQYQTYNNPRSRHLHTGPHYTLQMNTQIPNPGQHQRRHHHRHHNQTFQQPQHNRNQSRTIGDQLSRISLEEENDATAMQSGSHHHHNNRHRHHRRGYNHHQAAASHPRPALNQSHPQNSRQTQAQAVPIESSGQGEAMAQSQPLPSDRPAQTQSLSVNPQVTEVKPTTSDTSGQREAIAQSQPLPSDRPAQTQSLSVNPQEPSVQPTPSSSADEREAMVQPQPLRAQSRQSRPALNQSQPENRQRLESSTNGNESQQPRASTLDARITTLVSLLNDLKNFQQRQLRNRNYRSFTLDNQSQQPSTAREELDRFTYLMESVFRILPDQHQRIRNNRSSTRENQWQQPAIAREELNKFADWMISLLQKFVARPSNTRNSQSSNQRNQPRQPTTDSEERESADLMSLRNLLPHVRGVPERSRNYQELFRLLGSLEDTAATRLRDMTFHRSAVTRHRRRQPTYIRYIDGRGNAEYRFYQSGSDDDFSDFDIDFNQYFDSSDDDFNATDDEMGQIPDYHPSPNNGLSEDKIQEIPTRQFSRGAERSGSDQTSCVFCMCDFEDKQLLRILPCFHEFHAKCVDEWLKTHQTCPVCRYDVRRTSHGRE